MTATSLEIYQQANVPKRILGRSQFRPAENFKLCIFPISADERELVFQFF
jgi:hypothetical protein